MPSAKDQGFTEDQIEDFKEVFQLFDTKGDGLIQVRRKLLLTKQASNHSPLHLACDLDSHNMGCCKHLIRIQCRKYRVIPGPLRGVDVKKSYANIIV